MSLKICILKLIGMPWLIPCIVLAIGLEKWHGRSYITMFRTTSHVQEWLGWTWCESPCSKASCWIVSQQEGWVSLSGAKTKYCGGEIQEQNGDSLVHACSCSRKCCHKKCTANAFSVFQHINRDTTCQGGQWCHQLSIVGYCQGNSPATWYFCF